MYLKTLHFHASITLERVSESVLTDENIGICVACGTDETGHEPDARGHKCQNCGEMAVYGAEELLIHLAV